MTYSICPHRLFIVLFVQVPRPGIVDAISLMYSRDSGGPLLTMSPYPTCPKSQFWPSLVCLISHTYLWVCWLGWSGEGTSKIPTRSIPSSSKHCWVQWLDSTHPQPQSSRPTVGRYPGLIGRPSRTPTWLAPRPSYNTFQQVSHRLCFSLQLSANAEPESH